MKTIAYIMSTYHIGTHNLDIRDVFGVGVEVAGVPVAPPLGFVSIYVNLYTGLRLAWGCPEGSAVKETKAPPLSSRAPASACLRV